MHTRSIAFGGAIVLFLPQVLFAQVVISEILYDADGTDTGREWIEIYNEGPDVTFTDWKLRENDSNHGITALGSDTLPSGRYAVIVDNAEKFKADWPQFNGLLFDSAFSLKNTGETLVLRCCAKSLEDKDTVTYSSDMGGAQGVSLSRSGSTFVPTDPTPGGPPGPQKESPEEVPAEPQPAAKLPEPKPMSVKPAPSEEVSPQEPPASPAETGVPELYAEPAAVPAHMVRKPEPTPDEVQTAAVETAPPTEVPERARETSTPAPEFAAPSAAITQVAASAAVAPNASSDMVWWIGALSFSVFGAGAVMYLQRRKKRQWHIVEDSSDVG